MSKSVIEHWCLILDRATPHNNVLIKEIVNDGCIDLTICYALEDDKARYDWKISPTHEIKRAIIYGKMLNISFLLKCLFSGNTKFIIVGWANINTTVLHILFFLTRRKFNHWSDLPDLDEMLNSPLKSRIRDLAYWVLRNSNSIVFGVGISSVLGFKKLGFNLNRIVNLPIFIELHNLRKDKEFLRQQFVDKNIIRPDKFILIAGSRLVYEKGFDLLISALQLVSQDITKNICLIIVGSGVEFDNLNRQVIESKLQDNVIFTGWLEMTDFIELKRVSDVFVHPARFDSYGGTMYAMEAGLPVIGSTKAGAAVDRICHGVNGFLYDPNDIVSLSKYITLLFRDKTLRLQMGKEARKTALKWPPKRGVEILKNNLI